MLFHILQTVLEENIQIALRAILSGNTTTESLDTVADNLYQIAELALAGEVISSEVNKRTLDLPNLLYISLQPGSKDCTDHICIIFVCSCSR